MEPTEKAPAETRIDVPARIAEEFKTQSELELNDIGRGLEDDVREGRKTPEQAEQALLEKQQQYESKDFNQRALLVTNNFWMWWDKDHREMVELMEESDRDLRKALITDADEIIVQMHLERMRDEVLTKRPENIPPEHWNLRMRMLATIYLKMLQKGYDRKLLRG